MRASCARHSRKAHKRMSRHAASGRRHGLRRGRHRLPDYQPQPRPKMLVEPPTPPIALTPLMACSPDTPQDVLWHIAEYAPHLRRWLVANPAATPAMLEYLAQVGGKDVGEALNILLESLEAHDSA